MVFLPHSHHGRASVCSLNEYILFPLVDFFYDYCFCIYFSYYLMVPTDPILEKSMNSKLSASCSIIVVKIQGASDPYIS